MNIFLDRHILLELIEKSKQLASDELSKANHSKSTLEFLIDDLEKDKFAELFVENFTKGNSKGEGNWISSPDFQRLKLEGYRPGNAFDYDDFGNKVLYLAKLLEKPQEEFIETDNFYIHPLTHDEIKASIESGKDIDDISTEAIYTQTTNVSFTDILARLDLVSSSTKATQGQNWNGLSMAELRGGAYGISANADIGLSQFINKPYLSGTDIVQNGPFFSDTYVYSPSSIGSFMYDAMYFQGYMYAAISNCGVWRTQDGYTWEYLFGQGGDYRNIEGSDASGFMFFKSSSSAAPSKLYLNYPIDYTGQRWWDFNYANGSINNIAVKQNYVPYFGIAFTTLVISSWKYGFTPALQYSGDGGQTWFPCNPPAGSTFDNSNSDKDFYVAYFERYGYFYARGKNSNEQYKSTDGIGWTKITSNGYNYTIGNQGFAGYGEMIATDGGLNDPGKIAQYMADRNGTLMTTTDQGTTWLQQGVMSSPARVVRLSNGVYCVLPTVFSTCSYSAPSNNRQIGTPAGFPYGKAVPIAFSPTSQRWVVINGFQATTGNDYTYNYNTYGQGFCYCKGPGSTIYCFGLENVGSAIAYGYTRIKFFKIDLSAVNLVSGSVFPGSVEISNIG